MPIIIDANGEIIEGVIRVEAALQLGMSEVPCIVAGHLTHQQAKQLRVAANRLQERGSWNLEALRVVFQEFVVEDFDISIAGFEESEIDLILQSDEPEAPLLITTVSKGTPPLTQRGDILHLGLHRVICGDARDPNTLQAIMHGDLARIVLTDRPYNVAIQGHVTSVAHRNFEMASGEMTDSEFSRFNHDWLEAAMPHLIDGGMLGTFIDWRGLASVHSAATDRGLQFINLIVWAKNNAGMGSLYRSQHELFPLYKKGTAPHVNNIKLGKAGRWRSNVWSYAGASSFGSDARAGLADHPTVKPVSMLEDALIDLTNRGDVVLDPFLGSGSTLIAAERSGRICRGIEIDPRYVDLIVRNYEKMTGEKAFRVNVGDGDQAD